MTTCRVRAGCQGSHVGVGQSVHGLGGLFKVCEQFPCMESGGSHGYFAGECVSKYVVVLQLVELAQ